jgi:chitin elicitor receptor kinase 1
LTGIASQFNASVDLVKAFSPGVVWDNSQPTQYAFIPLPDTNYNASNSGTSDSGKSTSTGVIAGAVVGGIVVLLAVLALALYYLCVYRPKRKQRYADALSSKSGRHYSATASDLLNMHSPSAKTGSNPGSASFGMPDYTVDKSVEFTYEELANATDNFSIANKIGQGGFAVVFYGVIRGQRLAIKRMNLQSTKEFRAELQVLTHVHHTNLVQLIGYCTTDYLFLVYEFVENGTLDFHLHSARAAREPLSWSFRVQIALDAARGLEYIHEHTRPSYIHRDIKSANILLDEQFHAKVADFGLTKLTATKVEDSGVKPTNVVGTWGYMAPEYARFGDVSPMLDVYAFGIVLLEILSGKEAIIRGALTEDIPPSIGRPTEEQRALVHYFEPLLKGANGKDKLPKFMDPALGDNYPSDAAWKMVQLAAACTHELPSNRPTMRKAVVSLMTLSSTTHEWEVGAFANHSGTTRSG